MRGLIGAIAISGVTLACTPAEESDDRYNMDNTKYAPPASGPAPYPEVENAAPLNNAEGYPEQARNTMPSAADRETSAAIRPLGSAKLHGDAQFEQIDDGVRMTLEVEGAQPNTTSRVTLEKVSCEDVAAMQAHPPSVAERTVSSGRESGLGKVEVGDDGKGKLVKRLPDATLAPDLEGTLRGKSVVLYRAERIAGAARAAEMPVACAMVGRN